MQLQADSSFGMKLFLLRVLRNPRRLGAVAPSSRYLGALLARHAFVDDDSPVVELGGGTGSITRALMKEGIAPSRIYVVELDPSLASYLKTTFPNINVIQGNAAELGKILPPEIIGKVQRVVSGLPLINMPEAVRHQIIESSFEIMAPEGVHLQYTYSPRANVDAKAHGLTKKRLGMTFRNLPPATVWQYTRQS